jgi:hypothetical protein
MLESSVRETDVERVAASELRSQDRFAIHAILVARIACCSFVLSVFLRS